MGTATHSPHGREPQLAGQTVVVIGGSAGIGLETARLARAKGAKLVLTSTWSIGVGSSWRANITKLHRLEETIGADTVQLTADDWRKIESAAAKLTAHSNRSGTH